MKVYTIENINPRGHQEMITRETDYNRFKLILKTLYKWFIEGEEDIQDSFDTLLYELEVNGYVEVARESKNRLVVRIRED